MGMWKSRGLRGSFLEDLINKSNELYLEKGLALIQKIPTPITPIKIDKEHHQITLAYFEKKSTVDYIGAVHGIPVCFDAKECHQNVFHLQNIHEHQVDFMTNMEHQGGIAFLLIYFSVTDEIYYMTYQEMMRFWQRMEQGGRKSFRKSELCSDFYLEQNVGGIFIPYLEGIQKDLELRD